MCVLLSICVEEHCVEENRNRPISICLSSLPLHLWAIAPSSKYFPSFACSSRTQIGPEDWSVLYFHKVLSIFPFYSTLLMPASSVEECLVQDLSLRVCWEAFSPQLNWAVIWGRNFLMGWRNFGTLWFMHAIYAARCVPWKVKDPALTPRSTLSHQRGGPEKAVGKKASRVKSSSSQPHCFSVNPQSSIRNLGSRGIPRQLTRKKLWRNQMSGSCNSAASERQK